MSTPNLYVKGLENGSIKNYFMKLLMLSKPINNDVFFEDAKYTEVISFLHIMIKERERSFYSN